MIFTNDLTINIGISIIYYYLFDRSFQSTINRKSIKDKLDEFHPKLISEFTDRSVSFIHALSTALMTTMFLSDTTWLFPFDTTWLFPFDTTRLNWLWDAYINSMAYSLYHSYKLFYEADNPLKKQMYVHHIAMFYLLWFTYQTNQVIQYELVAKGLLMEWSTVFLQPSLILNKIDKKNNMVFKVNSWLTLSTFLIFRIFLFLSLIPKVYQLNLLCAFFCAILYCFNLIWFSQLVKHQVKNLLNKYHNTFLEK